MATKWTVVLVLLCGHLNPLLAELDTYESDSLPGAAGWTEVNASCLANQWIEDGLLFQNVPLCPDFPGFGSQFDYEKLIGDLSQEIAWFAEWRIVTTGPSEELPYTAPAAFLVWDGNALLYHFSIADDRVRFIRQLPDNPVLYFDIEPGVFHIFRVELFGEGLGETYAVYIDGDVVDAGTAEGPLWNPPWPPEVKFRAKSKFEPSTTTWDYIRWGTTPSDGSGDLNSDSLVDDQDLPFFQECLDTIAGNWVGCSWADFTGDGAVDCGDGLQFQLAWTGPGDPPSLGCTTILCHQDLNDDSVVNASDLALLLGAWGVNPENAADFNGDGIVNAADLAPLLGAWGPCSK